MTDQTKPPHPATALIATGPRVINVGLVQFAEDLAANGSPAVHVAWTPPAGGDARLARLLAKLGS